MVSEGLLRYSNRARSPSLRATVLLVITTSPPRLSHDGSGSFSLSSPLYFHPTAPNDQAGKASLTLQHLIDGRGGGADGTNFSV